MNDNICGWKTIDLTLPNVLFWGIKYTSPNPRTNLGDLRDWLVIGDLCPGNI